MPREFAAAGVRRIDHRRLAARRGLPGAEICGAVADRRLAAGWLFAAALPGCGYALGMRCAHSLVIRSGRRRRRRPPAAQSGPWLARRGRAERNRPAGAREWMSAQIFVAILVIHNLGSGMLKAMLCQGGCHR